MNKIDSIWAFIASDETGEGIVAMTGLALPLIAADEARLKSIRPLAKAIATKTKSQIKLIKLSVREEVEVIDGTETEPI